MALVCQPPSSWLRTPPRIEKALAFPHRQLVKDRGHEANRRIEGRGSLFAAAAEGVLGIHIAAGEAVYRVTADGAPIIQRFGPGVADQGSQPGFESLV